jgi:hypothetical protein
MRINIHQLNKIHVHSLSELNMYWQPTSVYSSHVSRYKAPTDNKKMQNVSQHLQNL